MSLRSQIRRLSIKAIDEREFYPQQWLYDLLTREMIQPAIERSIKPEYKWDEATDLVVKGGRKLFAILIIIRHEELLTCFLDRENLQHHPLDSKLPLDEQDVREIIGELEDSDDIAREFCTSQWAFVSPVFGSNLSHRTLRNETILPFLLGSSSQAGKGASGEVDRVALHKAHQEIVPRSDREIVVVRKHIERDDTESDLSEATSNFRNEEEILSYLRALKHASIVELLASYTLKQEHYMLFPSADCDLEQAFRSGKFFDFSDRDIFHALCGLSSALKHVHVYSSERFRASMIGCHHDLKPKNILIIGRKFLLADFGLSSLKVREDSASMFKAGTMQYLAPECLSFTSESTSKNLIGRASDVWAFGAIASEILTFMVSGNDGVELFRSRRTKTLHDTWTVSQFHHGGKRCESVHEFLNGLQKSLDIPRRLLLKLIRSCLHISPDERPEASFLVNRLYEISESALLETCKNIMLQITESNITLQTRFTKDTLFLWTELSGLTDLNQAMSGIQWLVEASESQHEKMTAKIEDIMHDLNVAHEALQSPIISPVFAFLEASISELWSFLPEILRKQGRTILKVQFGELYTEALKSKNVSTVEQFGILAAMKDIEIHLEDSVLKDDHIAALNLSDATFEDAEQFGQTRLATIRRHLSEGVWKSKVLIEWIQYNASWAKDGHGDELLERVAAIASRVQQSPSEPDLNTLNCLGFYHAPEIWSIGLVFELPLVPSPPRASQLFQPRPITLRELIKVTSEGRASRPFLGSVFRLASYLTNSIVEYHTCGWLHKNVTAYNIIFFPTDLSPGALLSAFDTPYLIGFSHTRQSDEHAFTVGPPTDSGAMVYSHPRYLTHHQDWSRFRHEYDYYSMGIVLLELGMWRGITDWTLSDKWSRLNLNNEQRRQKILADVVPGLGARMGKVYRDSVVSCLEIIFEEDSTKRGVEHIVADFQRVVAVPLSTLLVV
ncbi:hypothetical protein MMC17_009209 [Xylographa soralifera]|nr:hypothetical protein [Xylographa soralifera]